MIRRAQNRGYATLARIADHLERLAVGDESNAAIDAHRRRQPDDGARRQRASSSRSCSSSTWAAAPADARAPIRVGDDAAGEASVAIADYQSEADEDAQAREREETKRLLYVALTRARDRLYLSATVQGRRLPDGAGQPRRGAAGLGQGDVRRRRGDRVDRPRRTRADAVVARAASTTSSRS